MMHQNGLKLQQNRKYTLVNAFGYEMYCQFSFTVKMHQSIYKASTHRIMQFSLKIDIIVWSLSLSSTFFYQL